MNTKKSFFCILGAVLLGFAISDQRAVAQLSVNPLNNVLTPQQLVNRLLGSGVSAFNVTYTGSNNAAGSFCGGTGIIGFQNGIVLTSGSAINVIGPNNSPDASTDNGLPGDPALDALIPGYQTFDACVLEFDFIPQGNQVQFNYVFGSEEYNEFVNSPYNDVFGFFVNGVNFALLPGTATPVSINNVNNGYHDTSGMATGPCQNCSSYIDNTGTPSARNTQLDGLTVVLPMIAPVVAGAVNHMKIAIADAGDHILDSAVFLQAGSLQSSSGSNFSTRTARFWFTHAENADDSTCTTLKQALVRSQSQECGAVIDLGFLSLPVLPRYGNVTDPAELALIETLGLYYRSSGQTGETGGTQGSHLPAAALCRARKLLSVELVAATANNLLLGTSPINATYKTGKVVTNFPSDLMSQATQAAAGDDVGKIKVLTALLQKFNSSGVTNNFPGGLIECSPNKAAFLRQMARDPSTHYNCPGVNDTCASAEIVAFPLSNDPFALARFQRSVDMRKYPTGNAYWEITPTIGLAGRKFTATAAKSNFASTLTVLEGQCTVVVSNGITTVDSSGLTVVNASGTSTNSSSSGSIVVFKTDGTNSFYIEASGGAGKLNLTLTSP